MNRPNIFFQPFKFLKYLRELEYKNARYETEMKYRPSRLQYRNGINVETLIAELKEHQTFHGKNVPVSIEFVTTDDVQYKSVFDVISNVDGVFITNWPRLPE